MTTTAAKITRPALNLLEELAILRSQVARSAQEPFWFTGNGATTAFPLPRGWVPKFVYVDGALKREGSGEDYTITYDGFARSAVFAVAPGSVDVGIVAVRDSL